MKPDWLIIKDSPWYGTTICTTKDLVKGSFILLTSYINFHLYERHIISKYGNIFNSTDNTNDVNISMIQNYNGLNIESVKLIAKRHIKAGEELLMEY